MRDDSNPIGVASLSERRKSPRADLVVRVDYQTVDELFSDFARNVNEGGIFVETDRPHPLGTHVELQFNIPGCEDPIQVTGAVVRHAEADHEVMGMGIEFENLDAQARQHINALVRALRTDRMGG
ncbi:TIGR02266 family protein [Myxococcota bacterium]|nr:TIGR02266 family protein [Myxococcota bacterium]